MINWILWLILGAIAGYLARIILGRGAAAWWQDVLFGALGAVLGGYIAVSLGLGAITGFNLYSLLVAVFGAIVLLLLLDLVRRSLK
ncbi:MAG: GlsB/YeaQ/YmgE family stress response membrane protein [Clostridia bacterium]|nr:GlsB/YeaQ/YmgE family stress response membrane protein [Clostridia bacterium]MBR6786620.1 GlsB/YeaQ/YmgE family stress response membrane protein [Clostridia bacterium]